ncbi:hypothetical protein ACQ4M3_29375 [Leptolyngbya sp. AN03gr2]|uniref:hypothetical protein n=1 Tax=unclassified Leptolyngbya TaxID=2650499 RepID=UPI003D31D6AD
MNQFSKISIKAILIGLVVDIVGTLVVGMTLGFILGIGLATQSRSQTDFESLLNQAVLSPGFLILSLIVGLGFTFLGSFVAARIANRLALTHSGIVGAIAFVLGSLYVPKEYPFWFIAASLVLTIPSALLGGIAARK